MIPMHVSLPSRLPSAGRAAAIAVVALTVVLSGCGDKKKDKAATQTAARVNKEEITVHQINYVLSQQRGVPPEQAASAGKQVLERLIDQELALQKASEQKLDRDPRVTQQIEAARREIIARAYVDKIGAGAPKPTAEEVKAYYDSNPALFKDRRIYTLQELNIEATPEQVEQLHGKLQSAKDVNEFVDYMKANNIRFAGNQVVRPAEQLPLAALPTFAKMKDGQTLFNKTPHGAQVIVLAASRSQPVDEERARPAIEQFLLNERKRKVVQDDFKALRAAAKIEYVGDYVKSAEEKAAADKAALEVKPTVSALTAASGASAEPIVAAPAPKVSPLIGTPASDPQPLLPIKPASAPSGNALDKGLKGLK
ncbi:MAG TPA: EpsD family peptidyl-prolyl cis-trans isomerase [Albitalea sp.]|nr:EpsD family peptidyl-prolyl cis-trans isomerase [Albitalea sp.]